MIPEKKVNIFLGGTGFGKRGENPWQPTLLAMLGRKR